ncbi:hypothetical protein R4Z09_18395 [Niallia oryzisoli]|uniref:Uncharacterized protein n=1 Tax=Niallia oryzisoli TaxID=1737571 RepID=A0ABZ2CB88_9BACI
MSFMPIKINIKDIKLNNIDHLSAVSFGATIKTNRNVSAKKNQGFGQQFADGSIRIDTASSVLDNETLDSYSQKTNNNLAKS